MLFVGNECSFLRYTINFLVFLYPTTAYDFLPEAEEKKLKQYSESPNLLLWQKGAFAYAMRCHEFLFSNIMDNGDLSHIAY